MNNDSILLEIPSKPDYISLVRLTASSISHKCGLNIDEIEDVKVSIGEACINSLSLNNKDTISIIFNFDDEKLVITVTDTKEIIPDGINETKERELGVLIIKSLMDKVLFNETGIVMTKYFE